MNGSASLDQSEQLHALTTGLGCCVSGVVMILSVKLSMGPCSKISIAPKITRLHADV